MRRNRSTACHSRHSERRRRPRKGIGRRRSSSTDLGVLYIPDILRGGGGLGKASGVDATTRRYYRAVIADKSIYTNSSQFVGRSGLPIVTGRFVTILFYSGVSKNLLSNFRDCSFTRTRSRVSSARKEGSSRPIREDEQAKEASCISGATLSQRQNSTTPLKQFGKSHDFFT
ncbi:hypothetical protein PUN28_000026 [Cardiocondyla obscurior]|uniref:Uncharacterized protein n=1 Tax=Cardiocondyla obscurior TaxID=286306 RepID=A0AAW2GXI0_9HYME